MKRAKVLFSADGFGTFGVSMEEKDWILDARRYYVNIVGKYGAPVQALLKKAASLDIGIICPLHGRYYAKIWGITWTSTIRGAATVRKKRESLLPMLRFMVIRRKPPKS